VSLDKKTPEKQAEPARQPSARKAKTLFFLSWGATLLLVALMVLVLFKGIPFTTARANSESSEDPDAASTLSAELPEYIPGPGEEYMVRLAKLNTTIAEDKRTSVVEYTVQEGDSIFLISDLYKIKPETILWANYDLLNDDPTFLSPGWKLLIPPTDGIYYKWKEGDKLDAIAGKYKASVADIVSWPSNHLDVTDPTIAPDSYVMIPGGSREIKSWIVPVAFSPRSGANRVIAGPGGCQAPATGLVGSTGFIWPVGNHFLSGFDFTSYHLGIDIAAGTGTPVYASDSGTVVYAGWIDGGYGNLVEIDHNNGYSTLYGHLSAIYVTCGQNIYQGTPIGAAGSTGKSTGAHLHFEVRLFNSFVNPWQVLGY